MSLTSNEIALKKLHELASSEALTLVHQALGEGSDLHIVGGSIRDLLAGRAPGDADLTTALTPEEIRTRLEQAGLRCIATGLRHQTVTALVPDSHPIEITTFHGSAMSPRGGVSAGRTIIEDLRHRDFSINAVAFSFATCELIDPYNGVSDLRAGIVRGVEDPEARFREDPLRILRMVRFGAKGDFTVEQSTYEAAHRLADMLSDVSIERIRDEFSRMLLADRPDWALATLVELGLMKHIAPELLMCVGCEQNRFHRADVFKHTLEVVATASPELILRLAALFHDIGKPATLSVDEVNGERHFFLHEKVGAEMTEEILERLRYPGDTVKQVTTLVRTHMRPIEAGAGGLRRILRDTGELYPRWRELKEVDTLACNVNREEFLSRLARFDEAIAEVKRGPALSPLASLAIDGNDLLSLGMHPGPTIGRVLRTLHEQVLDDPELNTREELLNRAAKLYAMFEAQCV